MITYLKGDAIKLARQHVAEHPTDEVIIPHVCNDAGAWGSGFVIALSNVWPIPLSLEPGVEARSPEAVYRVSPPLLGDCSWAQPEPRLSVVNMVAQTLERAKARNLQYGYLARCMAEVALVVENTPAPTVIYCPKFGSDRAGGDWQIIEELIDGLWEAISVQVVEYAP